MLLSFPLNPDPTVMEIISDSIYANSATLDGRRFAQEFCTKRKADAKGQKAGTIVSNPTGGAGRGSSLADSQSTTLHPPAFLKRDADSTFPRPLCSRQGAAQACRGRWIRWVQGGPEEEGRKEVRRGGREGREGRDCRLMVSMRSRCERWQGGEAKRAMNHAYRLSDRA